jgi:hypothetical protein
MERISTIENLLNLLGVLEHLKDINAPMRDILDAESTLGTLAQIARERVIKHAIQSLFNSRVGVNASFVRDIVKVR